MHGENHSLGEWFKKAYGSEGNKKSFCYYELGDGVEMTALHGGCGPCMYPEI